MIRKSIHTAVLALTLVMGSQAYAGAFIEPIAGYHFGNASGEGNFAGDDSYNGLGFGARAGLTLGKTFWLAGDFHYGMLKDEADVKFKNLQVGAVLGARIKKFRIWGGVNFINDFKFDEQFGGQDVKVKGMGFKAGVGFMPAKSISINVEYHINPMTDGCLGETCTAFAGADSLKFNSVFASVSFPFGFSSGRGRW